MDTHSTFNVVLAALHLVMLREVVTRLVLGLCRVIWRSIRKAYQMVHWVSATSEGNQVPGYAYDLSTFAAAIILGVAAFS